MTDDSPSDYKISLDDGQPTIYNPDGEIVAKWDGKDWRGEPINADKTVNAVPIEALEQLADEWEEFAEPNGWDGYSNGVREATEACAQELRELLEDHR